jgi:beta-lactam-binding protein with PASTA domain
MPGEVAPLARSRSFVLLLVLAALGLSAQAQVPSARPTPEKLPAVEYVPVPDLSRLDPAAAAERLRNAKLRLGATATRESSAAAPGTVIAQAPAPKTRVQTGSAIDVWIAGAPDRDDAGTGPATGPPVTVPNVVGMSVAAARQALARAGLQIRRVDAQPSAEAQGTVIGQAPGAGAAARRGQSVDLRASDGSLARVPDLRGRLPAEASALLQARGLRLGGRTEQTSSAAAGRIIGHSPPAGRAVERGSGVDIVIATAPPVQPPVEVEVPDLRGRELAIVRETLGRLELRLGKTARRASTTEQPGAVIDQQPVPGTRVARGSAVNVWLAEAAATPPLPPEALAVPNVVGLAVEAAEQALGQAGLRTGKVNAAESVQARGTVLAQLPQAGARARRGAPVDLRIADGSRAVVPDLRGKSPSEAAALLQPLGLAIAGSSERESATAPGRIVQHSPGPGATVRRGSGVAIVVGRAATVAVPAVAGLGLEEARTLIGGRGLAVGGALPAPGEQPAGTVLTQDPAAGTAVAAGTPVRVTVSDGSLTRIPTLGGLSELAAQARLSEAGLTPGDRADEESVRAAGEIVGQALAAGTLVARGTRVGYAVAVPQTRAVPSVTGLSVEEAAARLGALGLRLTEAARRSDAAAAGIVIAQRPDPAARVPIGTAVAVDVSSGGRFGLVGWIVGIGAVLAAVGVAAAKVVRPSAGADRPTVDIQARLDMPELPARSVGPLERDGPAVHIRTRLEIGAARLAMVDRLVERDGKGNG